MRPSAKKRSVFFLGHLTTTEPKQAAEDLNQALKFKWETTSDPTNSPPRTSDGNSGPAAAPDAFTVRNVEDSLLGD